MRAVQYGTGSIGQAYPEVMKQCYDCLQASKPNKYYTMDDIVITGRPPLQANVALKPGKQDFLVWQGLGEDPKPSITMSECFLMYDTGGRGPSPFRGVQAQPYLSTPGGSVGEKRCFQSVMSLLATGVDAGPVGCQNLCTVEVYRGAGGASRFLSGTWAPVQDPQYARTITTVPLELYTQAARKGVRLAITPVTAADRSDMVKCFQKL